MRTHFVIPIILLACFATGCTGNIELVGYGTRPDVQHGLKVELISNGPSGALIAVQNISSNIISINQSHLAIAVSVKKRVRETLVEIDPCGHIKINMNTSPRPDDFVIIAPGQTKNISVPVSYANDKYRTLTEIYKIEKGSLHEIAVRLDPYFGTFTKETASKTLAEFKIPNYLHEPLMMNTMTIRTR